MKQLVIFLLFVLPCIFSLSTATMLCQSLSDPETFSLCSADAEAISKRALIQAEFASERCGLEQEEMKVKQKMRMLELKIKIRAAENEDKLLAYYEDGNPVSFQATDRTMFDYDHTSTEAVLDATSSTVTHVHSLDTHAATHGANVPVVTDVLDTYDVTSDATTRKLPFVATIRSYLLTLLLRCYIPMLLYILVLLLRCYFSMLLFKCYLLMLLKCYILMLLLRRCLHVSLLLLLQLHGCYVLMVVVMYLLYLKMKLFQLVLMVVFQEMVSMVMLLPLLVPMFFHITPSIKT